MSYPRPTSAQTIYRLSCWVAALCLPISLAVLTAWGMKLWRPLEVRPQLALMVYMAVLLVGMLAFCVAVLTRLHSTIGEAFAQGYKIAHAELRLGFTPSNLTDEPPRAGQLRAVE